MARGAASRGDDQVVLALEEKAERERALEPGERRRGRVLGVESALHQKGAELRDGFGVRVCFEIAAGGGQFLA